MWKWIRRLLLGLLALLVLLVVGMAGAIIVDGWTGPSVAEITNTTFETADGEQFAYLAIPEGEGPHPAILLIHEWWGLNEGMTVLADALAEEGYLVLAPDAYRGAVSTTVPRALWLRLTTPEEQVRADLDAALATLRARPDADLDNVATMGFCFGGGESLQLGLRQSENTAVTVVYYGALVTNPDLLRPWTDGQAVLGVFGEADQQIFVEDVLEFEAALNSLDIENQISIYADQPHAFLTEENYDEPGPAGDAWQETLIFLEENLNN